MQRRLSSKIKTFLNLIMLCGFRSVRVQVDKHKREIVRSAIQHKLFNCFTPVRSNTSIKLSFFSQATVEFSNKTNEMPSCMLIHMYRLGSLGFHNYNFQLQTNLTKDIIFVILNSHAFSIKSIKWPLFQLYIRSRFLHSELITQHRVGATCRCRYGAQKFSSLSFASLG